MTAEFHVPVHLIWGADSLGRLPAVLKACGVARPLLVTDRRILEGPAGRRLLALLGAAVAVFDGCGVDGRVADVDACAARMRAEGLDGVVGLGGGSALCTAKGAAIAATSGAVRALEGLADLPAIPAPFVLIPTTAGSGTEVSPFTILRDDADGAKFTIGGTSGFARAAILDPLSLEGLPPQVAAPAAVDALSHAFEAATSLRATPLSDALAQRAVRLLFAALEGSIIHGDVAARGDNLLGSSLANLACGQARLGLAHRLARPLEKATGASHGRAIGALLPLTLQAALQARLDVVPDLARDLGLQDHTPDAVVEALRALYDRIGFDPTLPPADTDADTIARAALHRRGEPEPAPNAGDAALVPAANGQSLPLGAARSLLAQVLSGDQSAGASITTALS